MKLPVWTVFSHKTQPPSRFPVGSGGHKEVFVGNVGYTLELFVGNTERPVFSTFTDSIDPPHIGGVWRI